MYLNLQNLGCLRPALYPISIRFQSLKEHIKDSVRGAEANYTQLSVPRIQKQNNASIPFHVPQYFKKQSKNFDLYAVKILPFVNVFFCWRFRYKMQVLRTQYANLSFFTPQFTLYVSGFLWWCEQSVLYISWMWFSIEMGCSASAFEPQALADLAGKSEGVVLDGFHVKTCFWPVGLFPSLFLPTTKPLFNSSPFVEEDELVMFYLTKFHYVVFSITI